MCVTHTPHVLALACDYGSYGARDSTTVCNARGAWYQHTPCPAICSYAALLHAPTLRYYMLLGRRTEDRGVLHGDVVGHGDKVVLAHQRVRPPRARANRR
eukprot:2692111-Rhodomonas_salina.1